MRRLPKWWPKRVTTNLILDANVFVEIYSVGDLIKAPDNATSHDLLMSRKHRNHVLRSRCSNLLAWYFAQNHIATAALLEGVEVLWKHLAPPDNPHSYTFTRIFTHALRERLFKDWANLRIAGVRKDVRGHRADSEILRIAKKYGDIVITNEGVTPDGYVETSRNLRGRCRRAGVSVYSPLEYLISVGFDIHLESRRLAEECSHAVREIYNENIFKGEADLEILSSVRGVYQYILFDEVIAAHAHVPRPSIPWYLGS